MTIAIQRGIAAFIAVALLATGSAAAKAPSGRPHKVAGHPGPVTVTTVPRVAGIRVSAGGHTYKTDARGALTLPRAALIPVVRVHTTTLSPGVEARFSRWYRGRIALAYWYRVQPHFVGPTGALVANEKISEFRLHSSIGLRQVRHGVDPFWIQGTRIVPFVQGLRTKVITYAVDSVTVEGANVVNRSQQHFDPAQSAQLGVRLLFNTARFTARDAIFHFAVGSGVRLRYPDGRKRVAGFGKGSVVVVPGLPRGQYQVQVMGGGWSPIRPVALSRNQDVKLAVITYLDVGVVLTMLGMLVAGLLFYRRRQQTVEVIPESLDLPEPAAPAALANVE
jgi:hypothetical protein